MWFQFLCYFQVVKSGDAAVGTYLLWPKTPKSAKYCQGK